MSENTPHEPMPDERPQRRREYSGAGSTLGVAALIIVVVGVAIWWFEIRGGGGGSSSGGDFGVVELADELNPTGEDPAAQEGRAAPDFRLRALTEESSQLTAYRGDWVLVNFWASWCGPCRKETPALQDLYERRRPDGLVVVGVNQQQDRDTAESFINEYDVTYPVVLDLDGEVSLAYRVGTGLPITMLVNPDGVIVRIYGGEMTDDDIAGLEAEYLE